MKNTSIGVHFFDKVAGCGSAALPKMHSSASIFQGFRSDLLLPIKISRYFRKVYFTENLVAAANRFKVFKRQSMAINTLALWLYLFPYHKYFSVISYCIWPHKSYNSTKKFWNFENLKIYSLFSCSNIRLYVQISYKVTIILYYVTTVWRQL